MRKMKKSFVTAGFFASFSLIVVYFALYLMKDERAWWISLIVGGALFLILTPLFFLAGLKRAARYDAYEKTKDDLGERFAVSFREKEGLHADARLYAAGNDLLLVDLHKKTPYEKRIRREEIENVDLSGEDIELYLKSGEYFLIETGEKEKLTPYFEKKAEEKES